jgi:hypothetical protein
VAGGVVSLGAPVQSAFAVNARRSCSTDGFATATVLPHVNVLTLWSATLIVGMFCWSDPHVGLSVNVRRWRSIDPQTQQLRPAVMAARVHQLLALVDAREVEIGDDDPFAGADGFTE